MPRTKKHDRKPSLKKTFKRKATSIKKKPAPLLGNIIGAIKPLKESDDHFLSYASYLMRGFGRRHFRQLETELLKIQCPKEVIRSIKLSACKFRLYNQMYPTKDVLWIFKNFLHLEGQKEFDDVFEMYLDVGFERSIYQNQFQNRIGEHDELRTLRRDRLVRYFDSISAEYYVPISAFPLIEFEKSRMQYSMIDPPDINVTELREIFTKYLVRLDVRELFVPPADVLFKMGQSKYNDEGIVRMDYEQPQHNYNSGFLYQKFMAQPLQPREVWLPGKRLKNNNLFLMMIGRQFLKREPRYPQSDKEALWKRIRNDLEDSVRVDISGFGFQYPRVILKCLMEVIEELYPCTEIMLQAQIFYDLLENVEVLMPDGKVVKPPRGIGLGYYEDFKTLAMIALLDQSKLISAYGDQFIIGSSTSTFETLITLSTRYGFQIKFDKIYYSSLSSLKWAGYSMSPTSLVRTKDLISKVLRSFFRDFPWERKDTLYSFYQENKEFYERHLHVLLKEYTNFFGYEFYPKDHYTHPLDVGINTKTSPCTNGSTRLYDVCRMRAPASTYLWDPVFVTPFALREVKVFSKKERYQFHMKRKDTYAKSPYREASLYGYIEPRVIYNGPLGMSERMLPSWADMLYLMNYGMSTGSLTYGLSLETCLSSISRLNLVENPLYAAKRGGYKVIDTERRRPVPSREWVLLKEYLPMIEQRSLSFIQRADLPTDPSWQNDELYKDVNLIKFLVEKRTKSEASIETTETQRKYRDKLTKVVHEDVSVNRLQTLADLFHVAEEVIHESDEVIDQESEDDEFPIDEYVNMDIDFN